MSRKANRILWIAVIGVVLSAAAGLSMFALRDGISFAMSPTELQKANVKPGQRVRLFGLVEDGSVERGLGVKVSFRLRDENAVYTVRYNDILPDLFRENQGIITEGVLSSDGAFLADTVLAKHDENYMPADMAEKLKDEGRWKGAESDSGSASK